eukprot:1667980-Amphidinium_carterae.1
MPWQQRKDVRAASTEPSLRRRFDNFQHRWVDMRGLSKHILHAPYVDVDHGVCALRQCSATVEAAHNAGLARQT